tara:strand:- start:1405 stop:2004 length:600 start_codon:yes stop_codon:yes gene_type:complete
MEGAAPFATLLWMTIKTLIMAFLYAGGLIIVMMVGFIWWVKNRTRNAVYVEWRTDTGSMDYELVPDEEGDGALQTKHGEYMIDDSVRMLILYPPGFPRVIQEQVRHEKYLISNPTPIPLEGMPPVDITPKAALARSNQGVLETMAKLTQNMADDQRLIQGHWPEIIAGVAVLAAAAAAYFGYQNSIAIEAIARGAGMGS